MLSLTVGLIKLFDSEGTMVGHIPADKAVLIAKAGDYEGKCSSRMNRVYSMKKLDLNRNNVDLTYRVGRSVVQPYGIRDVSCWIRWSQRTSSLEVGETE